MFNPGTCLIYRKHLPEGEFIELKNHFTIFDYRKNTVHLILKTDYDYKLNVKVRAGGYVIVLFSGIYAWHDNAEIPADKLQTTRQRKKFIQDNKPTTIRPSVVMVTTTGKIIVEFENVVPALFDVLNDTINS